jgi:hypothetical protein
MNTTEGDGHVPHLNQWRALHIYAPHPVRRR